jgi:hypothetical protein
MGIRLLATAVAAVGLVTSLAAPAPATTTYPHVPKSHDYRKLHIRHGSCAGALNAATQQPKGSDLPQAFRCKDSQKLTDYAPQPGDADYDPTVENNPQELYGVKGAGTNRAWEVTTGRPDTIISVLDSGIEWETPELVDKVALNRGELPPPCRAGTSVRRCDARYGRKPARYDTNHDGVFSVSDYDGDPRIRRAVPESKGRGYLTPEDLIRSFSDGRDHDHNGYPNDIAGWDFYQHDNDPADDVYYGHGTGEARDSSAEATATSISQCPNCRVLPLRVGDSFVADINKFAAAVLYATDNHVDVVQEALGTINHTGFAQRAVDYAYHRGVLIVASEADEEAGHHNYPAALNHTMVVNSVTHFADQSGVPLELPKSYLAFNGCTNFGGYTWVSVESNSCSSDATGQAAGIAGLLYSAAQNAVQSKTLKPGPAGRPLAAEEAKQLVRLAADDIDFSDPAGPGPPNNRATTLPDTVRYATTAGWDQITGWGRLNADRLVHEIADARLPGQADITYPRWWQILGTSRNVPLRGTVSAPHARSYAYRVEVAPGVQPPQYPDHEQWTTIKQGHGTKPRTGVLAHLNVSKIRSLINAAPAPYTAADDPTSPSHPEKDAFRVRVIVTSHGRPPAIEQREYFAHRDRSLLRRFPRFVNADATSVAFADLNGDGKDELVFGDGNGRLHAMRPSGHEIKGWPVHTQPLGWLPASGHNAFTQHRLTPKVHAPLLLGSPLVSDLDHDGYPEVAVTDLEGTLHVYRHDGTPMPGFPVHTALRFSHDPGCQLGHGPICDHFVRHHVRDMVNTVDKAFAAMPSAGDIDPRHKGLEIVAGSMDGHVYAWHADGTPVAGWPVLPRDPAKVRHVDPVSSRVTFRKGADPAYGRQVITTPTVANITGSKTPEVLVNVDEEYVEPQNYSLRASLPAAIGRSGAINGGNTRTYALWHDGTRHKGTSTVKGLGDNAYVPGWPVKIGMIETELLPDVGSGSNGSPVVGRILPGTARPQIATASIGGPPYLLKPDGSSAYGVGPDGNYQTMSTDQTEFKGTETDGPSIASLGGGALGRLGGRSSPLSFAMGATGLKRLLDIVLPDQQLGAEDHLDVWDATTGTFEPGFPAAMNDLMFFNTPAVADVSGDGLADVLQSSAMYDLRAYGLGGVVPLGWPKFTGGWSVETPAVGDLDGDGLLEVALGNREGDLRVWHTAGAACQPNQWPKYQHDLRNTGNYATDADPPAALRQVSTLRAPTSLTVSWLAPGGDGVCGTADHYVLTVDGVAIAAPAMGAAGSVQTVTIPVDPKHRTGSVRIQAVDGAGNLGFPTTISS